VWITVGKVVIELISNLVMLGVCSALSIRRTTSSRLVRDTDPLTLQGLPSHLSLIAFEAWDGFELLFG
jgi:hypothetical protein